MLKLTEQCFTEFKEVEAYKSDSKFLRVCLLYVSRKLLFLASLKIHLALPLHQDSETEMLCWDLLAGR